MLLVEALGKIFEMIVLQTCDVFQTKPAKVHITLCTAHMVTSIRFFNWRFTAWTAFESAILAISPVFVIYTVPLMF